MKAIFGLLILLNALVVFSQEDTVVWDRERIEEFYRHQDSIRYISPEEKESFIQDIISAVADIALLDSFYLSRERYLKFAPEVEKEQLKDPESKLSVLLDKWKKETYDWFKEQGKCKSFSITDFKMKADGNERNTVYISGEFWHHCGKKVLYSRFSAFKIEGKLYLSVVRIPQR